MYAKKTQNWLKYGDFILLDTLCQHAALVLAFMVWHSFALPYADIEYINLAVVYALANVLVAIANRSMEGVWKRGYYKEFEKSCWHVVQVSLLISLYMFAVKVGSVYSRATFGLAAVFHLLLGYVIRLVWKRFVLRSKKGLSVAAVYIVTTKERAEQAVSRFLQNNVGVVVQGL